MAVGAENKRKAKTPHRTTQFPKRKVKIASRMSSYGFNVVKFLLYAAKNAFALILGSIFSFVVPIVKCALEVPNLSDFTFKSAFDTVFYDWLYDDLFISIFTLGITLVIIYIWSFKREAEEYLGDFFKKVVNALIVFCLFLCLSMLILEIIYVWHDNGTNIGQLAFYSRVEVITLVVCCFLQNFSHPEYYMSLPQSN